MKTAFLHELRHPIGLEVVLQQVFLDVSHLDEPSADGFVDEGSV